MSNAQAMVLKVAAVLWVIWGLVHMLAGIIVIPADASGGLSADYHPAVNGILDQHGWNLLWGGLATIVGAVFIWRKNLTAIWVTGMIGGLLDFGYLVFVDIPGFVMFVPGTIMTFISGTAIVISFWVWLTNRSALIQAP